MATTANTPSKTKVVTAPVRLSYVHLFEAYASNPGDDAKFSCVIMVPKSDKATYAALRNAQQAALEAGKEKTFKGRIPKEWHSTIKDGDDEEVVEKNPEYAGFWVFNTSSKTRPGIIDRQKEPITDSTEVYSGCWARVSINAFAYNTQGNKGVSFGLNHVQKVRDDDFLGGRSRAEDDFDDYEDDEDGDDLV